MGPGPGFDGPGIDGAGIGQVVVTLLVLGGIVVFGVLVLRRLGAIERAVRGEGTHAQPAATTAAPPLDPDQRAWQQQAPVVASTPSQQQPTREGPTTA